MNTPEFAQYLLNELDKIPQEWALIPVDGNKSPELWKGWTKGFDRDFIKKEIKSGRAKGFGILTGTISGGLLAIDCDGEAAHELTKQMGGIPHTVSWSSGLPGRAQYLVKVPEQYWGSVATKKINTGVVGSSGKDVLMELRWDGCQSVFRGKHPDTGLYKSINDLDTPIAECPIHFIEKMLVNVRQSNPDQLPLKFNNNSIIPLYNFLSKNDRQLIDSGALNGSRNDSGAKLSRNLLGTVERLNYLGYQFEGNPEDLFNDFCDKCNPSLPQKERQTIWKSALKDNPTSTLTDDYLENIYKSFHRQQQRQSSHQQSSTKPNYQTSGNNALKPEFEPEKQSNVLQFQQRQQPQLNVEDIENELKILDNENLSKSQQRLRINELAKKINYQPKELWEIFKNRQIENEEKDSQDDIKSELEELLKNRNQSLKISEYLPGNLSKISEFSTRLCLRPELGLTAFLTTCSALLKVGSKIHLLGYSNFKQPMGIYAAIVAQPSQQKSPLINEIILEPLIELGEIEKQKFENEMRNYQIEYQLWEQDKTASDEPEKPTMRHHYMTGSSQAGVRNLLDKQSQKGWGLLQISDELSGAYKNSGKSYNIGLMENELSYYDGQGTIEVLKDGLVTNSKHCLFSKIGGIQPGVIREFLNGSDNNGFWSRWTFINQPVSPFIIPDNPPPSLSVIPMLVGFYNKLSQLPQLQLRLDPKAENHFIGIQNICEERRVKAGSEAIASLWGKMRGKIGRLAAIIHVIEQVNQFGTVQDSNVSLSTLKKAVALAKFYFNESQSLYISCTDGKLAPQLESILNIATARGVVAARDVQNFDRSLFGKNSGLSADDIRSMFTQLYEMGYGQLEGSGSRLKFSNCSNSSETVVKSTTAETPSTNGLQPTVVTVVEKNKNFQNESINQLDEITHIEGEPEKPLEPKNFTTVTTVPPNTDTVGVVAVVDFTTVPTTVTTVSTPPSDKQPTLKELTSAEPLPPLIGYGSLVPYESLTVGDVLVSRADSTEIITLKSKVSWYWVTNSSVRIDEDNIKDFRRK